MSKLVGVSDEPKIQSPCPVGTCSINVTQDATRECVEREMSIEAFACFCLNESTKSCGERKVRFSSDPRKGSLGIDGNRDWSSRQDDDELNDLVGRLLRS
jgi:hypothetical protein